MEHQFRQLPADRQVETRPFLEAVSYLPLFFGKWSFHSVTQEHAGTSDIPGYEETYSKTSVAAEEMGSSCTNV